MITYDWHRQISVDAWVGMLTTFSDHQALRPLQRTALLDDVESVLAASGGILDVHSGTYTHLARKT